MPAPLQALTLYDLLDILFSRRIIVFGGEFGRSKTLSMIAYFHFAWLYNNINTFFTNIPFSLGLATKYANILPLFTTDIFDKPNINTIYSLDEMQDNFDSREFMSPKIKYIIKWAKDLRKNHCQVVGTIQYFDFLEIRVSMLMQVIIIPTFVNTYHLNENKDIQERLKNKDFRVIWYIIDRKVQREYELELNLYPYINRYLTAFRPTTLITNHTDYLRYLKNKSVKQYNIYIDDIPSQIDDAKNNFNIGMKELNLQPIDYNIVLPEKIEM